jgi:hypothetical protein
LRYIEYITIKENSSHMSLDEFKQLKRENRELQGQITEILDQITPDDELLKENRNLSDALNGMMHDNMLYKNHMDEMKGLLQNMQIELKKLKNKA